MRKLWLLPPLLILLIAAALYLDGGPEGASISAGELAEQLASQGWGLILLWMKGLVPLEQFEARSLRGLLTLLLGVTRGPRRRALNELLNQTPPVHCGRKTL